MARAAGQATPLRPALDGDCSWTSLGIGVRGRDVPRTVKKERCPPPSHIRSLQTEELLFLGLPARRSHATGTGRNDERAPWGHSGAGAQAHCRTQPACTQTHRTETDDRDVVFMVENHVVLWDELQ